VVVFVRVALRAIHAGALHGDTAQVDAKMSQLFDLIDQGLELV
jgi:hypothetical protein